MKSLFCSISLSLLATIPAVAQSSPTQPSSASATPQPAAAVSPQSPGLPASPIVPGLPGFTFQNQIISGSTFPAGQGPYQTNQFGQTAFSGDLAAALQNLQAAIAQNLPVLTAFNNNLTISENTTNSAAANGGANNQNTMARNTSSLQSTSLANNNGANFSSLAATPTAPAVATAPSIVTQTGGQTTVTPLGASGTSSNAFFAGAGGVNGNFNLAGFTQRDALRELIVLQADMERSLQILAAINGNGAGLVGNSIASSQNRVSQAPGVSTTTTTTPTLNTTTRSQVLTPTGR
jgi:hypothetical protein